MVTISKFILVWRYVKLEKMYRCVINTIKIHSC